MKPFHRKDQCTNALHCFKDQDSVDARREQVRGIGNIQHTEWLTVVTATTLAFPHNKYIAYHDLHQCYLPVGSAERKRAISRSMDR